MSSIIEPLLDPHRVAHLLGVQVDTLGVWRRRGFGPRWYRIGKRVKYSLSDVQSWMTAQAKSDAVVAVSIERPPVITSEELTVALARRIMGWGVGPDRFLKGERRWTPRWHFQPLRRLEHALQLIAKANAKYSLTTNSDGTLTAVVRLGDMTGTASRPSEAAAITIAIAHAISIEGVEAIQ